MTSGSRAKPFTNFKGEIVQGFVVAVCKLDTLIYKNRDPKFFAVKYFNSKKITDQRTSEERRDLWRSLQWHLTNPRHYVLTSASLALLMGNKPQYYAVPCAAIRKHFSQLIT